MRIPLSLHRFSRRQDGTIAVLWAAGLVVILGFAAVAYDLGRMINLQGELQGYADQVALAAAGELDGKSDAITRARAAAADLVSGSQRFGSGSTVLSGSDEYTLTFLSKIMDETVPGSADVTTTDAAEARFARVVVLPHALGLAFVNAVGALTGNGALADPSFSAEAVAGFTQDACDITPLMFCLPSPGYKADAHIGDQILLRAGGQGAAWGPGDFGFLRLDEASVGAACAGLNGAQRDRCLLAAEKGISICYSKRGVDTEPGQKVGIEDSALNTRFDIFNGAMSGDRNDSRYSPAANVIKGIKPQGNGGGAGGNSCIGQNEDSTADTAALPRDDCFASGTCADGRFGGGSFTLGAYLDTNHGDHDNDLTDGDGSALFTPAIDTEVAQMDPEFAAAKGAAVTRYELYLREIALGNSRAAGPNIGDILLGREETGRPMCSANVSNQVSRRTLIVAGVNCDGANGGTTINGQTNNVPVEEYFKVFLTEPVGQDSSTPPRLGIYGEVIGSAGEAGYSSKGGGGIFRDVVQLYR